MAVLGVVADEEVAEELQILGKKMKVSAQQLATDIGHAGVMQSQANTYLKAELGYSILIRALNKGVEASEMIRNSQYLFYYASSCWPRKCLPCLYDYA